MNRLTCEMCNSTDMVKQDGFFVCQSCGTKYTVEEAKKMMIEGTVDVQGTVKVDNSAFVEKYLANARRAYAKEDWEEVEKYYNMVEQNAPNNMEAVFFSAYGKAMLAMTDSDYHKRAQKFTVLDKSISVINDYYETTNENKEEILRKICDAIVKMYDVNYVYNTQVANTRQPGGKLWQNAMLNNAKGAVLAELSQIAQAHPEHTYISDIYEKLSMLKDAPTGACYVATCVYGSYDCPEVWTLRRFRDNTLGETWYGRAFIRTYYAISPTIVKWFGETGWFKNMWKGTLDRMIEKLRKNGVEDTPYEDKKW